MKNESTVFTFCSNSPILLTFLMFKVDITRERINMIENRANRYGNEMQITMNNMLDSFRKWIATNYLSEMQRFV